MRPLGGRGRTTGRRSPPTAVATSPAGTVLGAVTEESRKSSSSGPQSSTEQMMSRSSSLMLCGCPDHSPDILPALMTSP